MYIKAESDADPTITLEVDSTVRRMLNGMTTYKDDYVWQAQFMKKLSQDIKIRQESLKRPLEVSEQLELAKDRMELELEYRVNDWIPGNDVIVTGADLPQGQSSVRTGPRFSFPMRPSRMDGLFLFPKDGRKATVLW